MSARQQPRIALVAITRKAVAHVVRLAPRLPAATIVAPAKFADRVRNLANPIQIYDGPLRPQVGPIFERFDQIVLFVSVGAVVRLIAPHLKSKEADPGVLAVDDEARFVIPVLSGHVGGANAFAEELAALLGATPVITTASEVGNTIAVDILGRELGWQVEAPKVNLTRVSAHVVNGEPIAVVQEAGRRDWWNRPAPLPGNIHLFDRFEDVDLERHAAVLWITHRPVPDALWTRLAERLVVYRPPEETDGCA